jgi:lipoprotein-releasing system permease protein
MKLSFSIALRFLKSNIGQTIIIILGIGIGVSVQIFIGSLIGGLQKGLVETTIGNSSQITITSTAENKQISDYSSLIDKTKKADDRIEKISPVFDSAAFFEKDGESQSLLVRGFDLQKAEGVYKISEYIVEGKLPSGEKEVLLGTALKEKYKIKVGDTINLITPDKKTVSCKILGFFDLKVAQINNNWCITTLDTTQKIFDVKDVVTAIEIQVLADEVFLADEISEKVISNINDKSLKVDNWKVQNEQLLSGLQGQSISSLMIQVFVMISVILGIASVLAITVMQKSKQIGILKAMGIKNSLASYIFLFEGLILGVFGAIVGVLFGLGLAYSFTTFAVNADGTPVVALYIDNLFIALSSVIAILACIVASLIPARRSSKLSPIDIIRNN